MNAMNGDNMTRFVPPRAKTEMLQTIAFLEDLGDELEDMIDLSAPNPDLRMALLLMRSHLEGRAITPTSLIGASRVPYATANRRLKEMVDAGLIEQRARTKTGKSFSMHPSETMLDQWSQLSGRVRRIYENRLGTSDAPAETTDYYFGGLFGTLPPFLRILFGAPARQKIGRGLFNRAGDYLTAIGYDCRLGSTAAQIQSQHIAGIR